MYVCRYVGMYVCASGRICLYVYMYVYIYIYMFICMYEDTSDLNPLGYNRYSHASLHG